MNWETKKMARDDLNRKRFSCWVDPELHREVKKLTVEHDITYEQLINWLFEKVARKEITIDDTVGQRRF